LGEKVGVGAEGEDGIAVLVTEGRGFSTDSRVGVGGADGMVEVASCRGDAAGRVGGVPSPD
jgi:hypothetical protein